MSVEVGKAKEGLYVFNRLWSWLGLYNIGFGFLHGDSGMQDDISEERSHSFVEFAFLGFSKEMMFLETFENCSNHRDVLSDVVGVREYM